MSALLWFQPTSMSQTPKLNFRPGGVYRPIQTTRRVIHLNVGSARKNSEGRVNGVLFVDIWRHLIDCLWVSVALFAGAMIISLVIKVSWRWTSCHNAQLDVILAEQKDELSRRCYAATSLFNKFNKKYNESYNCSCDEFLRFYWTFLLSSGP